MINILKYTKEHEFGLLALLEQEPDWNSFLANDAIDSFKRALLESETYVIESQGDICGYVRALLDGFGVYVSELYVAPSYRGNSYGAALLKNVKQANPDHDVYVFSDEDRYYDKLGCKRVGSVFRV